MKMKLKSLIAFAVVCAMASSMVAADYYLVYKTKGKMKGYVASGASYVKGSAKDRGFLLVGMTELIGGTFSQLSDAQFLVKDGNKMVASDPVFTNIQILQRNGTKSAMYFGMAYNVDVPVADPHAGQQGIPATAVTGANGTPSGSSEYFIGQKCQMTDIGLASGVEKNIAKKMSGQSNEAFDGEIYASAKVTYSLDKKLTASVNQPTAGAPPPATIDAAMSALWNDLAAKGWSSN